MIINNKKWSTLGTMLYIVLSLQWLCPINGLHKKRSIISFFSIAYHSSLHYFTHSQKFGNDRNVTYFFISVWYDLQFSRCIMLDILWDKWLKPINLELVYNYPWVSQVFFSIKLYIRFIVTQELNRICNLQSLVHHVPCGCRPLGWIICGLYLMFFLIIQASHTITQL